jgi:hypothetical protein
MFLPPQYAWFEPVLIASIVVFIIDFIGASIASGNRFLSALVSAVLCLPWCSAPWSILAMAAYRCRLRQHRVDAALENLAEISVLLRRVYFGIENLHAGRCFLKSSST